MTNTLTEPVSASLPSARKILLRIADLDSLPKQIGFVEVSWELHDGVPVPMSPPGFRHSRVANKILKALNVQGEDVGLGECGDEVGIVLQRNPDRMKGPDCVFLTTKSLPAKLSPEGFLETIPELVVEVRSKNDTNSEVLKKVEEYLAAGVEVVWIADPQSRSITAYRKNQPPQVFKSSDDLTAPDVIPNFRVSVDSLFPKV